MTKIIALGNALVDVMTMLTDDSVLEKLNLPKGSMQLVDQETSQNIQKFTADFSKSLASGGSAANTIRSLANLGVSTGFVGKICDDEMGKFFAEDMKKTGVFPHLKKTSTPTGIAVALISPDSERTFATYLGAASELSAEDISDLTFKGFDILHIEGYLIFNNELIEKAVATAKKAGLKVSIDLASYNIVEENLDFLKYLIDKYIDIVFANEEEAKAFTGQEPEQALEMISSLCEIAVVKVGRQGSLVKGFNEKHAVAAIKAKPIDTTGAGDNYAAGFLYGLTNNWDLNLCAKAGSLIAGNVVEVVGATMDENRWKKIKDELKQF
ncbi:MAG: adenosine kinase [Bacteroidales bacterium]|nr:adenosine kinase [Bacteroidales bacterium]MCK9499916.1 adenosine kinase [Bacteroidales bacterium]